MVNSDHVFVNYSRGGLPLAGESTSCRSVRCERWRENFYGDDPIQLRINRLKNDASSASADYSTHIVTSDGTDRVHLRGWSHQSTFNQTLFWRGALMFAKLIFTPLSSQLLIDRGVLEPLSCFSPPAGFGRELRHSLLTFLAPIQMFGNSCSCLCVQLVR